MQFVECDERVVRLAEKYVEQLNLPGESLWITTKRDVFANWLGRTVPYRIGGAYSMHPVTRAHRILVHLERLDLSKPQTLEVVVAEELIHMRDHLAGDFRRHSHHGFDRIAVEVERVTGFSPEQQRAIFKPRNRWIFQYFYQCPRCESLVPRRRRGTWSCRLCSPRFNKRLVLREVDIESVPQDARDYMNDLNRQIFSEE